jgi:hypothetical protein
MAIAIWRLFIFIFDLLLIPQTMEILIVLTGLMAYWPMPMPLARASGGIHTLTRMKTGPKNQTASDETSVITIVTTTNSLFFGPQLYTNI